MGGFTSAIGGLVGTVGGVIGGSKAADAAKGQAEALRAAADKASGMAAFTPYGMTTSFGTSNFEDGKGSYTLSPELQALQKSLFGQMGSYDPTQVAQAAQGLYGGASQSFGAGNQLFNLGGQYLAQSPEEARAEYMRTQQAALAPQQEQQLSAIRNRLAQSGRTGLSVGGTESGSMQASNPELQAYYNSLAQRDLNLATQAEAAAQQRQTFGTSLLTKGAGLFGAGGEMLGQVPKLTTAGYAPLEAQLGLLSKTEAMGQDPYKMSIDLANQYAQAGARQGGLYLQPQQAAAQAYSQYQGYSPMAMGLQGIGSSIQSLGNGFMAGTPNQATAQYYGTNAGSEQTRMLAEQDAGIGNWSNSGGGSSSWFSNLLGGK